jgi:predicted O-linked N-acetylglucosamine transferase (SPINDLY family)
LVDEEAVYWQLRGRLEVFCFRMLAEGLAAMRRGWDLDPSMLSGRHLARAYRFAEHPEDAIHWASVMAEHPQATLEDIDFQLSELAYCGEPSRHRLREAVDRWHRVATQCGRIAAQSDSYIAPTGRKLRLGLFNSSLAYIVYYPTIVPLLKHIGADERFEFILITDLPAGVALFHEITQNFLELYNLSGHTNENSAELIRALKLDILVDMNGFEPLNRLYMMCQRPAPIMIGWYHAFHSFGPGVFDYIIQDPVVLPPSHCDVYEEDILYMPATFNIYVPDPWDHCAVIPPVQRGHPLTFGSFNRPIKITDLTLSLWQRLLLEVPESRLFLVNMRYAETYCQERTRNRFIAAGIDPTRISFHHSLTATEWRERFNDVDIALDCFPFNGGVSTMEALSLGVPVPTWAGDHFPARVSASVLHAIGHPELIGDGPDDYIALTVGLARDPNRIAHYRATLRAAMLASPLCDIAGFAAAFGDRMVEAAARGPQQLRQRDNASRAA